MAETGSQEFPVPQFWARISELWFFFPPAEDRAVSVLTGCIWESRQWDWM